MIAKLPQQLHEVRDGRPIVAGLARQEDCRHARAGVHRTRSQNLPQQRLADEEPERPGEQRLEFRERTADENGQVIADLAQRPLASGPIAVLAQLLQLGDELVEILELEFSAFCGDGGGSLHGGRFSER